MMLTPIDYNRVDSIPTNKTLSVVNHFVINTTEFLNKFTYLCETKLSQVAREIERLEITMTILEKKLESIPGLESITVDIPVSTSSAPTDSSIPAPPDGVPAPPPPPGSGIISAPPPPSSGAPPPQESSGPVIKLKDHPKYSQYFKMLRIGVPVPQIESKMQLNGDDPSIIHLDPDSPTPIELIFNGTKEESESESDEEEGQLHKRPPPPPGSTSVPPPPPPGSTSVPPPPPPGSISDPPPKSNESESESSEED